MRATAFAKINLGLEVLFRREDGYHELRTIFQTIDLCDRLSFQKAERGITLDVDDPALPTDGGNLVTKAAEALARHAGREAGVSIRIEKKIPLGSGLGGGSSDAAVTLLALNSLWGLGLPLADLDALARGLGADVPFFLYGGTALGIGRGDEVYPLARQARFPIVLVLPAFSVETADLFRSLVLTKRESSLTLQYFASSGSDREDTFLYVVNDLESATMKRFPSIEGHLESLLELGAAASSMSGSGSAVFGVFSDAAMAESAARTLTARGVRALATRTVVGEEYRERRLSAGN